MDDNPFPNAAAGGARLLSPDPSGVAEAARLLRAGELVAFPTETVYGLGADATSAEAVSGIFAAKGRPADNPLIVHVASLDEALRVAATLTPLARELAEQWWPGPLTLVLPARPDLPRVTTGGLDSVGVRVPAHPLALELLEAADLPVAAPSANRSGRPSPTAADHVMSDLGDRIAAVLDGGATHIGVESTVVDARGDRPVVLREGGVTREQLGLHGRGHWHRAEAETHDQGDFAASPGTRYRHYAPTVPVVVAPPGQGLKVARDEAAGGVIVGLVGTQSADADGGIATLATFGNAEDLAAVLYDALRRAETAGVELLVVEGVPETGVGRAVMDRLRRAAAG